MRESVKINNSEAFCILMYHCQDCGVAENIFNNSNLSAPTIISCEVCLGVMTILPTKVIQIPDFKPPVGLRMFVEMTRGQAEKDLKVKIAEMWPDIKDGYKTVSEAVEDFMKRFYQPGEVAIVQVEEEVENDK